MKELYIQVFDFTNDFKCNEVQKIGKLDFLSTVLFQKKFFRDQKNWKHKLLPIEFSKNPSDRGIGLLIYKKHYLLKKTLHIFSGFHKCTFVCRLCLSSYTRQNILIENEQRYGQHEITIIRTSNESHLFWKETFSKKSIKISNKCRFLT